MGPLDEHRLAARLFDQHAAAVRRYFLRHAGDVDLADDLTQDVYMRIVQAAGQYEGREREAAWVFRIAHNLLVDHHRRRSRRQAATSDDVGVVTVRDASVGVELKEALGRLESQDRHAFLLCELGGLRYDEIAGILGLTTGAVRSRIFRARQELRKMLLPPKPVWVPARLHTRSDADDE